MPLIQAGQHVTCAAADIDAFLLLQGQAAVAHLNPAANLLPVGPLLGTAFVRTRSG